MSRSPGRGPQLRGHLSIWHCNASEYFSVYFRNSIFFFTTVVFLEEQHLWRIRLTILCTLRPHTKAGEGWVPEVFEQKAAIPQGSLQTSTQGQHQSAGLNVNSQCASCVLVCKLVCVQSYPRGPPQKPPQGGCWLCVTFSLSLHIWLGI